MTRVHRGRPAFITYLVLLHLMVMMLVFKTDFITRLKTKLGLVPVVAQPNPHVQNMFRYHAWMDGSVPRDAVVFLGDSIVQGLATAAVAGSSVNFGIGSENTAQLLQAIPSYESLHRASAIVLAIGINDFVQGKESGLRDRIRLISEALPRDVPLVWSAIMPVRADQSVALPSIAAANEVIKDRCEERGRCVFVNTWTLLLDPNGLPDSRYFLDDGLHLSREGYAVWIVALRDALRQRPQTPTCPCALEAAPGLTQASSASAETASGGLAS